VATAYNGDILTHCNPSLVNFERTNIVVVSGSAPNPCGHMLINTGGWQGWYFHVAQFYHYPRYMGWKGYQRYLKENDKKEVHTKKITIPDSQGAIAKLEDLMSKKWLWGILPHNCADFVEDIVQAGGADFGLLTNCPYMAVLD
jgi:hypothetical protein